jgi:hypothetical protein
MQAMKKGGDKPRPKAIYAIASLIVSYSRLQDAPIYKRLADSLRGGMVV